MTEPELVFILYPEIYVLLAEALKDKRFTGTEYRRALALVSAWDAAISEHGDSVDRVEVYGGDGTLTFQALSKKAWDGEVKATEEDE